MWNIIGKYRKTDFYQSFLQGSITQEPQNSCITFKLTVKKKQLSLFFFLTFPLLHPSTRSQKCNFVNPPSGSKCYHVLMAATHPPASPVEKHHRQSESKNRQDSLINLIIIPKRDKDACCRCRDGEERWLKKLQNTFTVLRRMLQCRNCRQNHEEGWLQWLRFVFVVESFRLWNDKAHP